MAIIAADLKFACSIDILFVAASAFEGAASDFDGTGRDPDRLVEGGINRTASNINCAAAVADSVAIVGVNATTRNGQRAVVLDGCISVVSVLINIGARGNF